MVLLSSGAHENGIESGVHEGCLPNRFWRDVMCKCCRMFAGVANQLVFSSIHVMVVSGFTGIVSRAKSDLR